jgi:phenylacetic acid degradation operon negative regulatory protein
LSHARAGAGPAALQPQDLALTILGNHLRRPGDAAWSGGMVQLLGEFGFSTEAARAALNRLATRGLIDRVRQGRQVHYELTSRADELLAEGDRRIFSFGEHRDAVDRWTVLWHSLPEARRTERSRLGARLRFLGFGLVQDAVWIAPRDRGEEVAELLHGLRVADHAYVIVGEPPASLDVDAILLQAWDLQDVSARYEAFLEEFAPLRRRRAQSALGDLEAFVVRTRATHLFRGFPLVDPELPDALMPVPRLRPKVIALFHALHRSLREPAERHFAEVALHGVVRRAVA